jgi:saccharopine dehydrogenase-like NADP-dependent oxidoreductase
LKVLLIGATGVFGARIAARLAHDARFTLTLAGRTHAALERLRGTLGDPNVHIAAIDVESADFPAALRALNPQLVIHAAGPFQMQNYRVAEACVACGSHYIDLADARNFVTGITALDDAARAAGVLVVSGASTVPALSSAVVDHLRQRFAKITSIEHAISPGNRTPRGDATVAAILGYCGKPVRVWRNGEWQNEHGWMSTRQLPFLCGPRWAGICDVPDLQLFPQHYADVESVIFRAGLELRRLHFGTWLLAWMVRLRLLRRLETHARALRRVSEWFLNAGSDEGGMIVDVKGIDASQRSLHLRWRLNAANGDGPQIPAMPAAVLARKLADGSLQMRGAMPCMGLFDLQEALAALESYAIRTDLSELKT